MAIFWFWPENIFAVSLRDVVINEVMWMGSSRSSQDEWIELKNNTNQKFQLNGWKIDSLLENKGTFIFPNEPVIEIDKGGFFLVSYYSKADQVEGKTILNNGGLIWRCKGLSSCNSFSLANSGNGDLVLRDPSGKEIDRVFGNSWPAGKKENGVCYSMERINPLFDGDNINNWATATEAKNLISDVLDKASPESENGSLSESTSTPSPTKATYKINDVKDEDGNILSSVKIYVDDVYLHHYAPETLTFCDGCQCDTYVNCDFGEHKIKLEKDDFTDWSETKAISSGDSYEVNPVMISVDSDSLLATSPQSSSTLTSSPKPAKIIGATLLGKILGEESTSYSFYPWEVTEEAKSQEATEDSKIKSLPPIIAVLGIIFLFSAASQFCYNYQRK